jgi:hypothetical protein
MTLRRVLLAACGVVFGSIALAAIGWPHVVAARYGLHVDGVEAMNEFRAVFSGFWLALAVLFIVAARRPEITLLGDLGGLALVLQAGGRLLSMVVDGRPRIEFVVAMVGEALAGAAILLLRSPQLLDSKQ